MTETAAPAPSALGLPPKVDPETLAIRSRPARAIRFRKSAIIGIAALGSASLMGIAWMALKPQVFRQVAQDSELSQPLSKPASDALSGLPTSYGDAPKLGPPLPGDLGRPILRAQQQAEGVTPPARVDTAEAERQQHHAELKAARESGLMAQVQSSRGAPVSREIDPAASVSGTEPTQPAAAGTRKEQFVSARDKDGDLNSGSLVAPVSPNSVLAGSVIAASLITGLNSDLPGMVTAQVTQNVFDTVTGNILLVPQGARLIGKYDSVVAFGQRRALVVWQRLLLPDGGSIRLDNMPTTDPAGYAGLADKVDFHTWTLLKGVAIATLLGVGSELSISGESDLVQAIRESAQSNTARAGDQITQRNLDIQPTVTIRPGAPVRVLVTRDLILAPWRGATEN
ncbi:TrbI/VirB10 family protein [Novosphingobium album (ex Liu et al. 2023)]|uniref:TrbI/VirB10 family protein n=1 Tax=Novosphingobium album (ex Liu et al. 2023) TaxID=3031130 RepID=A0ABT5WR64_9SPHN|nr:TrbI/VirB10 family protein [Novosphingobium album (ex Liu et al. 2023)]MDE8652485.1 TrbI/VirB10 family protein [Novosphingobium album (ex Liu et al. 2023)]